MLAARDPAAEVPGLDRVPRSDWPNVELTHLAFQVMVASGMALLGLSIWFWAVFLWRRRQIQSHRALLWALVLGSPLGFLGLEAGWFVTEVGRQPWIIQGVLRTSDAVTPAQGVTAMFVIFSTLYVVLAVTVVVLLLRLTATDHDRGGSGDAEESHAAG